MSVDSLWLYWLQFIITLKHLIIIIMWYDFDFSPTSKFSAANGGYGFQIFILVELIRITDYTPSFWNTKTTAHYQTI